MLPLCNFKGKVKKWRTSPVQGDTPSGPDSSLLCWGHFLPPLSSGRVVRILLVSLDSCLTVLYLCPALGSLFLALTMVNLIACYLCCLEASPPFPAPWSGPVNRFVRSLSKAAFSGTRLGLPGMHLIGSIITLSYDRLFPDPLAPLDGQLCGGGDLAPGLAPRA